MSVTVTYKCDKCGSEQSKSEQFWEVGLSLRNVQSGSIHTPHQKCVMQLCRVCTEGFGVVPHIPKPGVPAPVIPSLEDLIREIVTRCVEIPGQ